MEYRILGSTGERVSAVGLGGAHLAMAPDRAAAARIIHAAIDGGVTFLDNSWDYALGECEIRMGEALLGGHRDKVFLMTKINGQTRDAAAGQIDQCLEHLRTDRIDLVQLHEMIRPEDPERTCGPGGAVEALVAAREAGKIRYIGFTGHKDPTVHLAMLEQGFAFDTVQMPLNVLDHHFRSFEARVLPVLVERGIGVLGMKPLANGRLAKVDAVSPEECLRYALSLPASVVITGCENLENVEQALRVGNGFTPMSDAELADIRARSATIPGGPQGEIERWKTGGEYDGTNTHPHWLTTASYSA
ncbi:MAG TPA: aldo/keto reductase [Candidatus Dormibacteraeota bacterium]|nr:aldo/keto reductase [Candidatus Dormibacteraeota bacterium]